MGKIFKTGLTFLTFAGLTVAMSTFNPPSNPVSATGGNVGVTPSAKILHYLEEAADLPFPTPMKSSGKQSVEIAADLPFPTPMKSSGKQS